MSLALLWYAVDARKWFKGHKINVEHLIHTKVIDGQEGNESPDMQSQEIFEKQE